MVDFPLDFVLLVISYHQYIFIINSKIIFLGWKSFIVYFLCICTILFISFTLIPPSPSLIVTEIRDHIASSSPPEYTSPPRYGTRLATSSRKNVQHFLPMSTRVELYLSALGALRSWCLARNKTSRRRIEPGTSTLVVFEVNH